MNEFGFGALRVEGNSGTDAKLPMHIPSINVGFQNTTLSPPGGPSTFVQNNYNWKNVLTWVTSDHLLKFGFQGWSGDDDGGSASRSRPTFDFDNLLQLVTDDPREERGVAYNPLTGQAAPGGYRPVMSTFGAFVQDDWKVRRNLTLTMGLRWDDYGDISRDREKTISFANIFPGSGATNDDRFAIATVRSVESIYGRRLNRNFSPRGGFAWDQSNTARLVIRGGVGLYKDWIALGEANRITVNPPGLAFPVFRRGEAVGPIFSLGTQNSYPFGSALPTLPSNQLNDAGGLVGTRLGTGGIDREIDPANTLIYSFDAERQLPLGLLAASRTTGRTRGTGSSGPTSTARRDLGQAGTRVNRDSSFSLVSQNFYDRYKAVADHDRRHRFSFAGTFHLPSISGGNAVTRALLAGWMISGIGIFESGLPINIVNRANFVAVRDSNGAFLGYWSEQR